MGILSSLTALLFGTKEQRILMRPFQFSSPDQSENWQLGRDHYVTLLKEAGIDPRPLKNQIDTALEIHYSCQFSTGVNAPEIRNPVRKEKARLKPGDRDFIREEALKTFQSTGVYGLPSYGGHILTEQERREHGLP